jgi:hypothetical protein
VPCSSQAIDLPEEQQLVDVRVDRVVAAPTAIQPLEGSKPPAKTIPVRVQLDAPVGTFESQTDQLVLGIDADLDGKQDLESTLQLPSDREAQSYFSPSEHGFSLDTRVSDFIVDLPSDRLENVTVDVLRRLEIRGQVYEFAPVEVDIDAAPPKIIAVDLSPGPSVVLGGMFEAQVSVWDLMSGVQAVEVAFDPENTGKFPDKPDFTAVKHSDRRWDVTVAVDQPPGLYTLLVRAVDRVGNMSPPFDLQFVVIDPVAAATQEAARRFRLEGIVTYRDKPVAGATLTLEGEGDAEIPDAETDEQGRYAFPTVPSGEYELAARAVLRNVVRMAKEQVTLGDAPIQQLDVQLE